MNLFVEFGITQSRKVSLNTVTSERYYVFVAAVVLGYNTIIHIIKSNLLMRT